MKFVQITIAVALLFSDSALNADDLATRSSTTKPMIAFEARSGENGNSISRSRSGSGLSNSASVKIERKQEVEVEFNSFVPSDIQIFCYFLGRSDGKLHVYDSDFWSGKGPREKLSFTAKKMFGSSELKTKTAATSEGVTATALTISKSKGSKAGGWIVFLAYKGNLMKMKTSLPELENRGNMILQYGAGQYSIVDGLDPTAHFQAHAANIKALVEDVRNDSLLKDNLKQNLAEKLEAEATKTSGNAP